MKRLSICLIMFLSISVYADFRTEKVQYVETVPGVSQGVIYDRCILWIAENFRSTSVIQYRNRSAGKIIVKGIAEYYQPIQMRKFKFTMTIDIKPGKVRFTFGQFENTRNSNMDFGPSFKKALKEIARIKGNLYMSISVKKMTVGKKSYRLYHR